MAKPPPLLHPEPPPPRDRPPRLVLAAALVLVLALKIYILLAYGPDRLGDFARLLRFSDAILAGTQWLHDAGLTRDAIPPTLWAPPLYPLLIAAARLALGDHWPWGLFVLQALMSLAAGLSVRRLVLALRLSPVLAALSFVLYELSLPASTDVLIVPDGLHGSLATMVLCLVGSVLAGGATPRLRTTALAGFAILICFLLRPAFVNLVVPLGLALVIPALVNGASPRRASVLLMGFYLPAIVGAGGLMLWNHGRTGHFMLTSAAQTTDLTAALKVAQTTPGVFGGDTVLDRETRALLLANYDRRDAEVINQRLFRQHGLDAPVLARLATLKYWQTVAWFPGAVIGNAIERAVRSRPASMLGDLLARLDDLDWWRDRAGKSDFYGGWRADARRFFATRERRFLTGRLIANAMPRGILRVVSWTLFLLFALGLPWLIMREPNAAAECGHDAKTATALLAAFYLLFWVTIVANALVMLELSQLGPVCAIPIIGALVVARRLTLTVARRIASPRPA